MGFGNLGYRHFQSLLSENNEAKFHIVEPLKTNIQNFIEKDYNFSKIEKNITISDSLKSFKNIKFQVCIVSTTSKPRLNILSELLEFDIKIIILEKLLFPTMKDYEKISPKINSINQNIYVNCPKTEYLIYQRLKNFIMKEEKIDIKCRNIIDIGSNSIHWIDLAYFLTGRLIDINDIFTVNIKKLYESKRIGYHDFFGSIKIQNKLFNLEIESTDGEITDEEITIESNNLYIHIKESKSYCYIKKNSYENNEILDIPYQSQLTSKYLKSFDQGKINLTSFKDSFLIHKKFFKAFEDSIYKMNNSKLQIENKYFLT